MGELERPTLRFLVRAIIFPFAERLVLMGWPGPIFISLRKCSASFAPFYKWPIRASSCEDYFTLSSIFAVQKKILAKIFVRFTVSCRINNPCNTTSRTPHTGSAKSPPRVYRIQSARRKHCSQHAARDHSRGQNRPRTPDSECDPIHLLITRS